MFCPNCGNQLDDSARFCANCGNAVGQSPKADAPKSAPIDTKSVMDKVTGKTGDKKPMFWAILAGLHILQLLFTLLPCYSFGFGSYGTSVSFHKGLDSGFLSFLVIILLLGAAALCVLRILDIKIPALKGNLPLIQKIASGVVSALGLLLVFTSKPAYWSIAFCGWLLIVLYAVAISYVVTQFKTEK